MTPGIAFATYVGLGLLIFGLFAGSGRRLDDNVRKSMGRWMFAADGGHRDDRAWTQAFLRWFDQAFAVRTREIPGLGRLHIPSFRRSILVSFISLTCLALVWVFNKETMGRAFRYEQLGRGEIEEVATLLLIYGSATLLTNWIPDYLSLVESRFVMERMARSKTWLGRLVWLAVDGVSTAAISFSAIHIGMVIVLPLTAGRFDIEVGCLTPDAYSLETTWNLFVSGLRFESPAGALNYDATGIYVYSTFLTSVWIWVYLIGGFGLRAFFALRGSPATGRRTKPLRLMAAWIVIAFTVVYWLSWAHERGHSAEVYVVHAEADLEAANALVTELERGGLHVRSDADVAPNRRGAMMSRADTVVLLDGPNARAMGLTHSTMDELELQARCGERASGSTAVVSLDGDATRWMQHEAAWSQTWYAWQPGASGSEVVTWAQHADHLLDMSQIRACQVRNGYAPAPSVCDTRWR